MAVSSEALKFVQNNFKPLHSRRVFNRHDVRNCFIQNLLSIVMTSFHAALLAYAS
jgi:hypothetical protein